MKKISITEAREIVTDFCKNQFQECYNHDEFHAAITHWLHTTRNLPPFTQEEVFNKLPDLFLTKMRET